VTTSGIIVTSTRQHFVVRYKWEDLVAHLTRSHVSCRHWSSAIMMRQVVQTVEHMTSHQAFASAGDTTCWLHSTSSAVSSIHCVDRFRDARRRALASTKSDSTTPLSRQPQPSPDTIEPSPRNDSAGWIREQNYVSLACFWEGSASEQGATSTP
jgi:hypothetical protein